MITDVPRRRARSRSRAVALVVAFVAMVGTLAGCRVDATIDVQMAQDGSGTLTLTLDADADVVARAGGLAGDLRFDDLTAVGWDVSTPVTTAGGGLEVVLTHPFAAPEELTALLASLNGTDGPFKSVSFTRTTAGSAITFAINGTGRVDAGLASFADADLIAAVGATPYADDVASAGLSQSDAVVITFRVDLPGTVQRTTGAKVDGKLSWVIPLDSTPVDLGTSTSLSLQRGGVWRALSATLQVLFVAWVVLAVVVLAYVVFARQRRTRRPTRRSARGDERRGSAAGRGHPAAGSSIGRRDHVDDRVPEHLARHGAWNGDGRHDGRHDGRWREDARNDAGDEWGDGVDDGPSSPPQDEPPRRQSFPRPNT